MEQIGLKTCSRVDSLDDFGIKTSLDDLFLTTLMILMIFDVIKTSFGCVIFWTTSVMPRHEYDPLNLKDFSPSKVAFFDRRKRNLGGPKATATATSLPSEKKT
jgi:hypothetical protein